MKLYHGSYTEISVIDLTKAKPYKKNLAGYIYTFKNRGEIRMTYLLTPMFHIGLPI